MTGNNLYPLSLPQEAFYYDYLLYRNDCKYNMAGALILEGNLDIELYRKAYNYVIEKYDAMRIKFVKKEESLYQLFRPEYRCEIKYYDFRANKNPAEDAIDFIIKEYKKPLPIESEDLFSEMIAQTGESNFIFAPKFHHMIFDGYGRAIINQSIADVYNSLLEKGSYPEIKSFSYIDFINDDLQYRNSELYHKSFEYWKQKLVNLPEPFDFTKKKKSIKDISLHTQRIALNLHRIYFESILNIAFEADATTFQVILGLIAITLNKCYKRNELIIGMPLLNRSNYKFRNTPGLFMNMMSLRITISGDDTFDQILNLIKSEVREGYRHQRFPLKDIINYLRSSTDFNNELFDVTVVYRKNDYSQRFGSGRLHSITFDTEIRSESLSIEIDEFGEEENVNIFFNYNPLVISEDEIVQFVHCFETILMDIVQYPEKSIKELKLLNDFETHKILNEFNPTTGRIITEKTIVELFEETVSRKPNEEAVICNEKSLSYKELNERANLIANYLLTNFDVHREEIICLAAVRSIDAIAAMIGILKTGAAYLPIDTGYPVERIKYIVNDSGARILIKNGLEEKNLAGIEIDLDEINSSEINNIGIKIRPANLAYVIYTSGSTGKPKGVLIEHGQFMNMFVNAITKFGIKEHDRVLQFASPGFDASVFEIFQALLTGAALVIADKDKIQNTELFKHYLNDKKITAATLPPAYLKALDKAELPYLNILITAGEQAIAADVNFYKQFKRYINAYGPTETSVCASVYAAEMEKEYQGLIPIGRPLPNEKLYVLDENLDPVPIGFYGELCISGPNVARGYLNNDEFTKQKFLNNPFEPGTRLYRTGDLARWRQDGNLELLGRIDDQVKIDGNRIELGEIEARLLKFDNIKEAVVLDVQRKSGKELAAYIIPGNKIDINGLKIYLRKFLPGYMVPAHYVFIDKIPLTRNGKINKEALRNLPLHQLSERAGLKKASGEIENRLIAMFEEILDVRPVGTDDNFFELGGESLKITRLISRIYKELNREIGFRVVFDNPTVRSIAMELESAVVTEYHEIPAAPLKDYYALSHAQKRLWILAQNKENSAVYHMPVSLLLEGKLNLKAIEESLKIIINRHEALHTVFIDINGIPYQKMLNDYNFIIHTHDVSDCKDILESARILVNEKIIVPFNLSKDIPVRVNIIKLEEEKYILLLVIHHIAGDGISISIIMKELSVLYNSFITGINCNLKPLKIQYKDFCEFEKDLIESKKYSEEKQYWLKKLQSSLPVLDLVYDKPRPQVKTYSGDYSFYEIDRTVSDDIFNFCIERNVSLNIFMMSAVNILLHKYSSQEEIITGSPVAGRNHTELEDQVGAYINTIAIRNRVNSSGSILEFINTVKINLTEAVSNSSYPFDRLIQALNLDRDTSRTPLFDVLIQYQNENLIDLKLDGISASFFQAEFKLNKFDLTFTFVEEDQKVKFSIGYNTDLFSKVRIDSAARHINNIISHILKNPKHTIQEISLPDTAEIESLTKISSGRKKDFNKQLCIQGLFEEQVRKTPGNTALIFNDKKYSYKELDERANIVANEIILSSNLNPDDIIGIMTSRSELMVIGILGILKAGAAYMPIDPNYPSERIAYMLRDSKAKLLLTEGSLLKKTEEAVGVSDLNQVKKSAIITIDVLTGKSSQKPKNNIESSNLAYVIYTSGSTGKPKGVMIEHHSLHNLVLGLSDGIYNAQSSPLNIALIAPFVFDASVKQIFYALLNGHCLDIVPDDIKTSGRKLLDYYYSHRINVSDGTPVHLEIITDELKPGAKKYLPGRFVIGGQQLVYQTVKKIFDITGDESPVITNVYGPTECCDVSTCFTITPELIRNSERAFYSMPIGKPLNNVQVFILDSNLNQLPLGVKGELCISGEGLARGYINRQDLTEEKFIEVDGKRIYKTGDIGYYLPGGNIVLSGRTDDQVKVRGYRVELNEIENCLRNNEKIKSAAVIPVGDENNIEIAAYYSSAELINSEDLRNFLSLSLPAYMIPSYFTRLENFPLTLNGKVDKKSLPLPIKEISTDENALLPADDLEQKLCEIWKELLHVDRVNLSDNFFKLGGHSLIAIRLTSRIHKDFNIELNIWEIFQHPTILSLAKIIRVKNPSLFKQIEKIDEKEYYPLSHAQRRLWVIAKLEGHNAMYNLPGALKLNGDVNTGVLENVFRAIIQRHESFRTCFVEIDGEPFQKVLESVDFNIEVLDYSGRDWSEDELKELANDYFRNEFDLSKAPLLQIRLIKLAEKKYLLLFNMHHIISDGWSIEVMIKEFEFYYDSLLNHKDSPLKPLGIQYKDYASWQNKILDDKLLEGSKQYWHKVLSKPRSLLELPADFKRSKTFSNEGEMLRYSFDDSAIEALTEISRNHSASLFMSFIAVINILLYKYTGEEDIMIGSPVAGRQHYDLDNQIGFYINTLVLRNEVNPENSFLEFLDKIKETVSGALDNQVYPFDRLVDELDVERIQNRNPLFDVMAAWMVTSGMGMKFKFNGIEASAMDFRISKSMFDLSFLFEENEAKVVYSIEYNTSLFKRDRIIRMSEHFKKLISSVVSNPKEKIKNLEIVPSVEKEKLLSEFKKVNGPVAVKRNVIELFNYQAALNKNIDALVYEDIKITYDELNKLSNSIAEYIVKNILPVKDDIISVIVNDPIKSVVSLLAIMKAGAAYLPILPDNPSERIEFIINDSNSKAVLTDTADINRLGALTIGGALVIDINKCTNENHDVPEINIEPESLAYVIYTSGSTGTPKGVMIEHKSLANLIASLTENIYSGYKTTLNELMISSLAFDVTIKQIFASLCNGNTLHIMSDDRRLDPRGITRYIIEKKINITDLTPSLFSIMLEEGFTGADKPDLKEIFLGSEALPSKLVKNFYSNENNKKINITNFYGPTECCVESSSFRFNPGMVDENYDIAPIGNPIPNEQIFILDKYLNLCPIGVPGEICIAGEGLARQYLNDPDKTNEKFVHFPLSGGIRIYRTGDRGRVLSDGNIEFLGRMDEQVKLRGYRIELQEIEKHLFGLNVIKECAVTLFEKNGTSGLAAYYTSDDVIDNLIIKNHLNRFLPKYMIPAYFNRLEKMPLSVNGKIHKKLLPEPGQYNEKKKLREPQDEIELLILRICSEILKKDGISLEDNFFEIGGHSLNAVKVISRIQKELNIDLALKEIFYNPVLIDIAETVKKTITIKDTIKEYEDTQIVVVPISDEELKLLSGMQLDDEE